MSENTLAYSLNQAIAQLFLQRSGNFINMKKKTLPALSLKQYCAHLSNV
jgi:hypothetical protein